MPVNAPNEYYVAEEKYRNAKTRDEKIKYLEEMISLLPRHHGSEKALMELKKRLAKLKAQKEIKLGRKTSFTIKKDGAGQACLIGLVNSGKSTLLKQLTGVDIEIDDHPYTTVKPEVGMMRYEDVLIQIVEIPSTFEPAWMSIAHNCDIIIKVIDGDEDINQQRNEIRKILDEHKIRAKTVKVITKKPINLDKLKKEIWNNLQVIRVYTKAQGKEPEKKPIIFRREATVGDVVKAVHKDFLKHFRFARVWGHSVKHQGSQVGLDHKLADKDIVQIFA